MSSPLSSQREAGASPYAVLNWLVVAAFVVILNETVMVNAIPRLMAQFDVTESAGQWLSTAFMLTMAVVIPTTGWILQRFTTRQTFAAAMATFIAGTVLAAAAPTFGVLIAARVVQATGTAVMIPLLMTTLMTIVPEHDRGRVMGNVTLAISVAPALGPTVAGVILQVASWRWLFLVMLPIAAVITVAALRKLTDVGETKPGSLDVPSLLLAALGFGSLVFGLSALGPEAAAPTSPWLLIGGGLAVVAVFAWRQRRRVRHPDGPLLDLRTLAHATYAKAIVLQACAFLTMMGAMILLPLTLQDLRGLSALSTGLLVAPGGLAMGLAGPRVGRLGVMSSQLAFKPVGPIEAVAMAGKQSVGLVDMMITGIAQIFTGERSVQELGGPVKIAKFSGEQLSMGPLAFINFAALISLNLAFINLLPIPALDGGHLAFYAAEAVRRKPLGARSTEIAYRAGVAVVLALMVFVTVNDLVTLPVFGS